MTLTVRPADLEANRESLFGLLERNLPHFAHRLRFEWLYRANPAGAAWSWLACDASTEEVVGVASVFPRAYWIGGRPARCGQVGDFAVDATHRSLGPAVLLQRATFEPVDHGALAFCYDCPSNEQGMSTFRRIGIEVTRRTRRYARPLRADRHIERQFGRSPASCAIAAIANGMLAVRAARQHAEPGIEIAEHQGRFDDEFSALDRAAGGPEVIRSRRSAADLNWRYRDDPLHRYRVLTARRSGELRGFVVFSTAADETHVLDLFGHLSRGLAVALLDAVASAGRSTGAQSVRMVVGDDHETSESVRRAGFWFRGQGPRVVAYTGRGTGANSSLLSTWWVRQVDLLA